MRGRALSSNHYYDIIILDMPMSRRKTEAELKTIQRRRQALLREISSPEPLIVGTVVDVLRRCGRPSCHCAAKPAHRQTLLLYGTRGRRSSKFVRQKDADWVRRAGDRYRACKKALRELRALNLREIEVLRVQIQLRGVSYE